MPTTENSGFPLVSHSEGATLRTKTEVERAENGRFDRRDSGARRGRRCERETAGCASSGAPWMKGGKSRFVPPSLALVPPLG